MALESRQPSPSSQCVDRFTANSERVNLSSAEKSEHPTEPNPETNGKDTDRDNRSMKVRAVRGVVSLLTRQAITRLLGFAGMLVLARVLAPAMFGVFAIAQFIVLFFEQFSSLGLAAALIRKREPVLEAEIQTVFTMQMMLVLASVTAILALAKPIAAHYELSDDGTWLIRTMAFGLVLASLKTIPTVMLERRLRHDLIAVSETSEFLVYQITAITLAVLGFGVWSLVFAVLARGVTGVTILYSITRWRPQLGLDTSILVNILKFGVPIQMANFVNLANNATIPVVIGSYLGTTAAGYANFGRNLTDATIYQPLILVGRVQFRVFAHMQQDDARLAHAIERSLFVGCALSFLAVAIVLSQSAALVAHVLTSKWAPALPVIYVLGLAYALFAIAQPLTQALKALGDARTPLFASLSMFASQIGILVATVGSFGLDGYALGMATGIAISTLIVYRVLAARLRFHVLRNVGPPAIAACIAGVLAISAYRWVGGLAGMSVSICICVIAYVISLGMMTGKRLSRELLDHSTALVHRSDYGQFIVQRLAAGLARMDLTS